MNPAQPGPPIHLPARLKITATPAALPRGGTLSFTRQQDPPGLTPGNLITQRRKPGEADHITSQKTRNGSVQKTATLTRHRRTALGTDTQALRDL